MFDKNCNLITNGGTAPTLLLQADWQTPVPVKVAEHEHKADVVIIKNRRNSPSF